MMEKPNKLNRLMYELVKEASKYSLIEFLEERGISEGEFEDIEEYFKSELEVNFWRVEKD